MQKLLAITLLAIPATVLAQQKPPVAQYWMSIETSAGMSMPGMGGMAGMMGGMMGGQQQSGRKMSLQLGSQRPADTPSAAHDIPQGMSMGPSLPLLTPPRQTETRYTTERDMPEGMERPKGRMLIYWGCGEATRAGQPVVIDFARAAQGQMPSGFVSRRVAAGAPPSGRTTGLWPNQQDSKAVPDAASLMGEHTIRGNYTPDIRFALGAGQDFMERVELATSARGAGAVSVRWNTPASATGYFATAMGGDGNDMVFWSSSDVQESGGMLMDYVPPAEVARLIREKVVMPPQTTECTVPAEVVKKSGTPMMSFIAYGPEANFGHPPRPQDPQWYVKVRFKSTASTLLGEAGDSGSRRPQRAEPSRTPSGDASAQPTQPSAPDPLKEGVNILRGIFGR